MGKWKALRVIFALLGLALTALGVVLYFKNVWSSMCDYPGQFRRLQYLVFAPVLYNAVAHFSKEIKIPKGLITGLILFLLFVVFLNMYNYSDPLFRNIMIVSFLLTIGSEFFLRAAFPRSE